MGFFEIVGTDGLYSTKEDFEPALEHGSHLLVKTDEETLTAIQNARYLFRCGVGLCLKGLDQDRQIEYEIAWTEGIKWQGLTLTVAHVKERRLKPEPNKPEHTEFWILTTAQGFAGEDLRELAHRRWDIENDIFKHLNHWVGSKALLEPQAGGHGNLASNLDDRIDPVWSLFGSTGLDVF